MKTDKRKKGSFLSIIIRNYLWFSFAVLLALMSIVVVINWMGEQHFSGLKTKKIKKFTEYLEEGNYEKFPSDILLGQKGAFVILDENLRMIYRSKSDMPKRFTEEELFFVNELDKKEKIKAIFYQDENENERILIQREKTKESAEKNKKEYLLLDDSGTVLVNQMGFTGKNVNQKELDYIIKKGKNPVQYAKWEFKNKWEKNYTAVFRYEKKDTKKYLEFTKSMRVVQWLILPLYALIVAVFAVRLNHKVKRPLMALKESIVCYQKGQKLSNDNDGPDEFVEFGDDFVKLAQRLAESEERRKTSDEEKQQMLADISHDLKTPITIIQGYAKAICDGIIKEENKQQYLQTIYHKSIVLNELINAFSEYSKLEHPDFRPVKIKVDICEYAREYLAARYNELVLGGCSLEVEIPEMIIWCQIDVQQMKRVFENLINNSVKHNKRGTALFFSMKKEADTVCISIGDNGTGIPKELAQMVFEPFVVGDESRNSRQGTGLGLAIAKKIVEAHGGVIELVKVPKEGLSTEFRIWMYTDEE